MLVYIIRRQGTQENFFMYDVSQVDQMSLFNMVCNHQLVKLRKSQINHLYPFGCFSSGFSLERRVFTDDEAKQILADSLAKQKIKASFLN